MRLIDLGANNQLYLPTLELREQEIMNMLQNKPMRYRRSKDLYLQKFKTVKFSCKKLTNER